MRTTTEHSLGIATRGLGQDLRQARQQTDELFRLVRADSLYQRPIPDRHRILFYIGHLEAFDWNLMARYALDVPSFHSSFDRLFAFGIDPPPGELPSDQPSDWPALQEVEKYNLRTRNQIDKLLADIPQQLLHAAIEHRLMHAETFAYILHQLDYERKASPVDGLPAGAGRKPVEMLPVPSPGPLRQAGYRHAGCIIEVPRGEAQLGAQANDGFGWDNEFRSHTVDVPGFFVNKYKVTNGEYLEFVEAGAEAPFFWRERGGAWQYRGMFREFPLPLDCPVYVTHRQAEAYAKWRGMRLPTEAEWHRAADGSPASRNVNFRNWDPVPVTADDHGSAPPQSVSQISGNGWEWTSTPFAPFPGFEPFPFYANYSAPFFDGSHFVLKGASQRTAKCFLRPSFRNWFRPSYPYPYATFRMVGSPAVES